MGNIPCLLFAPYYCLPKELTKANGQRYGMSDKFYIHFIKCINILVLYKLFHRDKQVAKQYLLSSLLNITEVFRYSLTYSGSLLKIDIPVLTTTAGSSSYVNLRIVG